MKRRWKLQANPAETKVVLLHTAPFLVFLLPPLIGSFSMGWNSFLGLSLLFLTLLLGVLDLLVAVALPIPPENEEVTARFLVLHTVFICYILFYMLVAYHLGARGTIFYLIYPMSLWALQAPKRFVVPGVLLATLTAFAMSIWLLDEIKWASVVVPIAATSIWVTRSSIETENKKLAESARELLFAKEKERNRISSDLHDVLGQTLIALSLKAELAQKMLEAGQKQSVSVQLQQLQDLTRQALSEVRAVVSANRALQLDEELRIAKELCENAGVKFSLEGDYSSFDQQQQTICAYVIRESLTNALRHAAPTVIKISGGKGKLSVVNDITQVIAKPGSGLGLESLRQRIGKLGRLEIERSGNQWTNRVIFNAASSQNLEGTTK